MTSNPTDLFTASAFRFCIGATFTVEPLAPVISFWSRLLHLDIEVRFAPYNQIEQTLLDAGGDFTTNVRGVNAVAIRLEDFGQDMDRIRSNIHNLLDVLRSFHPAAPSILCLCPASMAFNKDAGRVREASLIADMIGAAVSEMAGVHFLPDDEIRKLYPVEDYEALGGSLLGHVPYTEAYYAALGTALVRRAHALTRRPFKAIALDCDNTLWSGICGEDGPAGITLDAGRRALQEFMLRQRDAGMLLAMASKNNEPDVIEAFEQNSDMPLQLRHFAAWRINWESKADNLEELAKALDLGLDSFILVDDNAKECAEVESAAPEVLAVALPADTAEIGHFLDHLWAFDHPVVTDEDRKRNEYYEQGRQFGVEARRTASLEQFMANLELKVRISRVSEDRIPRVAQLTQRTNQFNFTGIRRSEADIRGLIAEGGRECFSVQVSDRFGDYGLVGVMIVEPGGESVVIDTFLLSCRALGRGVEHRMMAFLAERYDGVIVARLTASERNAPARRFLDSIGRAQDGIYNLPAASLRGLTWKPAAATAIPAPADRARSAPAKQRPPEYVRIARKLSTPAQILSEMRRQSRGAMASPSTETEAALAEIWADLLKVPSIEAGDNFFDLGGHSLLAVLLLVRIHESFGVELSIDDVYSAGLTLAELAQRIDLMQLGDLDSAEYAELLQEIEALSDDEARQMLAEGEPPCGSF